MKISLIAGVARNGGIGRGNQLLWRLPEDLARFKALTLGHAVIMGRKTWDSLPERFRPLPGRRNIVLSRQPGLILSGAEVIGSLDEALAACSGDDSVFVIGGAQVYAQALPQADRLELTEVDADFEADAFFPEWDRGAFAETARDKRTSAEGLPYDFVTYQRK
ncbi:dihydrofolate reductase [Pelomonas sp. KK5]|uniref:dihydrofolate reductase n=1 Tax=Pelomonas sp. KK5 TaxID=1855730 RepID=UPI00097BC4E4|nr:dihydrofolate reductase [Pelomonas sp. KK5]